MNLLSQLAPQEGSKHYSKRLGRGRGSGLGQTSGKGHKGQLARSGGKVRRGCPIKITSETFLVITNTHEKTVLITC